MSVRPSVCNTIATLKNVVTKMKPLQRIIDLFIDITGLRPITFDVLDVFGAKGQTSC